MANNRIKFIFFTGKINLRNNDFSLSGIWDYLISKSSSMNKQIAVDNETKIPKNDSFSRFMSGMYNQFNHFLISTREFKIRF